MFLLCYRNGHKGIIAGLRPSDGEWIWSTLLETVEKRDPVLTFGTGGSYVFCRKVCHEWIIVCLLSEYIHYGIERIHTLTTND